MFFDTIHDLVKVILIILMLLIRRTTVMLSGILIGNIKVIETAYTSRCAVLVLLRQYTEGVRMIFMGVCAFCGDETTNVSRPMAGHMRNWAHRNVRRAHTHREIILMPSSQLRKHMPSSQLRKHMPSSQLRKHMPSSLLQYPHEQYL
jgi:hypothetical protein